MKKTKWFPGNQKPELAGAYEREIVAATGELLSWYSAATGEWLAGAHSGCRPSAFQCLPWRGLAEKPKA